MINSKKELSNSTIRPIADGITVEASSMFDRWMMSMGTQKGGASSIIRLQPQLTSSSLGLTPVYVAAGDISDMFAGVMNKVKRNCKMSYKNVKSQARVDQAQMTRNTDQCLGESLAQAKKESEKREFRMTREIERLLNDHDNTYAHTMTSLERKGWMQNLT